MVFEKPADDDQRARLARAELMVEGAGIVVRRAGMRAAVAAVHAATRAREMAEDLLAEARDSADAPAEGSAPSQPR